MHSLDAGLVAIAREFFQVHRGLRTLLDRLRRGELEFAEVQAFVGDTDASPLFRLKEHCHTLFRTTEAELDPARLRGALFDLAVGSLFHETMKLRENFYQLTVYAPRVAQLRQEGSLEGDKLFEEFERILRAARERLNEAVLETQRLLDQTRELFRSLLHAYRDNGLLVRYLLENPELVAEIFGEALDELLRSVQGDEVEAYVRAAFSYLRSAYFEQARSVLLEACARGGKRPELERWLAYAEGMSAYLDGRYGEALDALERWRGAGPLEADPVLIGFARCALARLPELLGGRRDPDLERRARELGSVLEAAKEGEAMHELWVSLPADEGSAP